MLFELESENSDENMININLTPQELTNCEQFVTSIDIVSVVWVYVLSSIFSDLLFSKNLRTRKAIETFSPGNGDPLSIFLLYSRYIFLSWTVPMSRK